MIETRRVIGAARYSVTSGGRVFSDRHGEMRQRLNRNGYMVVGIVLDNGDRKLVPVHRLVAAAFIGPANGRQVNHIDCTKTNNSAKNLEYVTPSENVRHAIRNGRSAWMSRPARLACAHGHPRSPENTLVDRSGRVRCKPCAAKLNRELRARKKADIMQGAGI